MRRDLIVAVSHDLRTPLASLRAMVEAIDDGVVRIHRRCVVTPGRCDARLSNWSRWWMTCSN